MNSLRNRLKPAARTTVAVMLAAFLVACAPANGDNSFPYARVERTCAPWDGPAVAIVLSNVAAKCGKQTLPHLNITLWRDLPPRAGQTIVFDNNGKAGRASYCPPAGSCEMAASGTVMIEKYVEGKSATGRYDFVFPKAGRITGTFQAAWCDTCPMCG
jgi:hypothetical protein